MRLAGSVRRASALWSALLWAVASVLASPAIAQQALGPQASAEQIRALRAAGRQDEVRLLYGYSEAGAQPRRLLIGVGPDYAYLREGSRVELVDLLLRRIYRIDEAGKVFGATSLHGLVDRRSRELEQREMTLGLPGVAARTDIQVARADLEASYGLFSLSGDRSALKRTAPATDRIVYSAGATDLVDMALAPQTLDPDRARSLARVMRVAFAMHPDAVDEVERLRRPVRQATYRSGLPGERTITGKLDLLESQTVEADYPLGVDLKVRAPVRDSGDAGHEDRLLADLWPVLLAATDGTAGAGARGVEAYRAEASDALRAGRAFEAYLRFYEMILQFGEGRALCADEAPQTCIDLSRASPRLGRDAQVSRLRETLALGEERKFDRALRQWRDFDRKTPVAHVLDLFEANQLSLYHADPAGGGDGSGLKAAAEAFGRALRGNPYASQFYHELGDHFYRLLRTDLAWTMYDLARALPYLPHKGQSSQVDVLELGLATRYPQFY